MCSIRSFAQTKQATEKRNPEKPSVIKCMTICHQNEYVYILHCIAQNTGDPNDDRT
jgi:hypothetical protein